MVIPAEVGRPYIYRTWIPGTPRPEARPTDHDTSYLGLGLVVGGWERFFPDGRIWRQY